MNEVTKVHLGRQAFTVSVAAHKALRAYLDAIAKQVDDPDVTDEVELRMAELLSERGIQGDKVVLPADVEYLKAQLGEPQDFKADDDSARSSSQPASGRRLFRDRENGMFAGVAAGLAAYFGVDVWLVRVLFVVATVAWGFGIPVYIVLWLLVPEAKTSSERLQMAGRPVTVDSLKEIVERADVKGAARRANDTLSGPAARVRDVIDTAFRLLVKIVGIGLTLFGLFMLALLAFGSIYLSVHGNVIYDNLFPIGFQEHLLVYMAVFVAALMTLFIILFGMAIFRRKWPIRTWLTGVLVGLTVIGLVSGSALAANVVPRVRDRYNAHFNTLVKNVAPFTKLNVVGPQAAVSLQTSDKYYVAVKYYDKSDPSKIKVSVKNGTLTIDNTQYQWDRHCSSLCLPNHFDAQVTVYSPNPPAVSLPDMPPKPVVVGPLYP